MDIPEIPNVSKSAAAYLLQAAIELATEAKFEPTSEAQMHKWIDRNSHAIAERAQELQEELLIKFYEHRQLINEAISTNIWGKVRHEQTD
jgi:predicted transcriptional regulator